ncbi:hypothetical protein LO763_11695 [Glycomyces sp. A-F 0318]|uniref:hypothetical protein n=1 Tax=Glycomyces amatae TaxID=2881355 RepID=UPI001E43C869|nr:hypothetical protein [Glycomyces amatae]MCD0444285.1 hypothetical protein [Glycomyces amatae]
MSVTNRVLAEGRLIAYHPHLPGTDDHLSGMVGVVSPITGQRRILAAVPVGETGQLIAVLTETPSFDAEGMPLAACAGNRTSVVLAAGGVGANTPIPGRKGPADLVGCAPSDGTGPCELRPETEHLLGAMVRLELHGPGCACKQPRFVATGAEDRAGNGDA